MVELELVHSEVQLMRSCLNFRLQEIGDGRKAAYVRLIGELNGIGLYRFNSFEVACIILSLVDFANQAAEVGHDRLVREAKGLAAWAHMQAYSRELGLLPEEEPEQYISREMAVLACVS
ncbi:hypothetical protein ACE3MQ_19895 [Paenibacillus lentus]|uniref:hypothetical protein n=1 Tax=Paenibacillus lentus TaxID=1338368 RepID=UPI003651EE99